MFSYRHAFHAGNHADVLKHLTLLATVRHLQQKDSAIHFTDTHGGAGIYRLDSDMARQSGEAAAGLLQLRDLSPDALPAALGDYLRQVAQFNPDGAWRVYPGSPLLLMSLLRPAAGDRLRVFEMHPSDQKHLRGHIAQHPAQRAVQMVLGDGFEALRSQLPPPATAGNSRRACVLIDPSYEVKTDYARVVQSVDDAVRRFPTGTYLIWYPIIGRAEAHDLPRKLRLIAQRAQRPWLHATLSVGRADPQARGLNASGMVVINPPYTLASQLKECLPTLVTHLGQGLGQGHSVEAGGG